MILEIAEGLPASVVRFKQLMRLLAITLSSLETQETGEKPQLAVDLFRCAGRKTKKPAAGGGAAGFPKKNRTAAYWRRATVPTDAPWEEEWAI
ncbi:MAG: hypothetical protein QE284_13070 [Rhizobium sp.]|nr:hypothetical protein [Rhizobium sp.]